MSETTFQWFGMTHEQHTNGNLLSKKYRPGLRLMSR